MVYPADRQNIRKKIFYINNKYVSRDLISALLYVAGGRKAGNCSFFEYYSKSYYTLVHIFRKNRPVNVVLEKKILFVEIYYQVSR